MAVQDAAQENGPPGPDSGTLDKKDTSKEWSVQSALEKIPEKQKPLIDNTDSGSPVPFFHMLERLKTTKREGWRRFELHNGESISDHMYRMAIMTWFAPPSLKLDIARCNKMALVHDMAELLVGDITPKDEVPKTEKNRRESTTMDYLCHELLGGVNNGSQAADIRSAWQEYEDGQTLESKFVHDVDKLELLLQMVEYERSRDTDLTEFGWVAENIQLPEMRKLGEKILAERVHRR